MTLAEIGVQCVKATCINLSHFTTSDLKRIGRACIGSTSITIGKVGTVWTSEDKTLGRNNNLLNKQRGGFRPYYTIGSQQVAAHYPHTGKSLEEMTHEFRNYESAGKRLQSMTAEEIFETCKGRRIRKHAKKLTSSERIAYGIRMERM